MSSSYTKALLLVHGMTCGACVATITNQLQATSGINEVVVSLVTEECHVEYNPSIITIESIQEIIEDCGFDANILKSCSEDYSGTRSAILSVHGMTCGACVSTIVNQLKAVEGIEDASVSLVTEECNVDFYPAVISVDQIRETIEDCGFDAEIIQGDSVHASREATMARKRTLLKVFGMTCGACSANIEAQLSQEPGIISVTVSLATEDASIEYDPKKIGIRDIVTHIEDCGFEATVATSLDNTTQLKLLSRVREIKFWKQTFISSGICAVGILFLYMLIPMWFSAVRTHFPYIQTPVQGLFYRDVIGFTVTTYVQLYIGSYFYKSTWKSYKHGSGTMDTLVCISTSCAYFFSIFAIAKNVWNRNDKLPNVNFETSAMLITFISAGKLLENKAKSQTSTALSKFISLTPSTCSIVEAGNASREIPVELLQVGDIVEVKPGMKIPADGIVTQGQTEVDESLITGESLAVPKEPKSFVIGGSVNGSGHFFFRATSVGDDTKLANIVQTMKQAQLTKAPIQRYADYLASKFVPFVLILSLITFVCWTVLCHFSSSPPKMFVENPNGKFYACLQISISVIVVACPCALGLAAPTAIMVGTGVGARNGVLIKGGDILERCNSLNVFLFDKTGTLTTGHMCVEKFIVFGNHTVTDEELCCIRTAETLSEHPVAKAIVNYTEKLLKDDARRANVIGSEITIGKGLACECELDGEKYKVIVGNKFLMPTEVPDDVTDVTVSYVSINGKVIGRFDINDSLKRDAVDVVQHLISKGYKVCMVTGDTHSSAMKIAQELGIEGGNVYSEVTPQEKRDIVMLLQQNGTNKVTFVGDGINDSPALVTSDLGVSISTGSDIAIESADVVVLDDADPKRASLIGLIYALDICQKTFQRVKLNFFWAICYNMFMLPISMGVLVPWGITLHPITAGAAMAVSSVSVIACSLLLNTWKPPQLVGLNAKKSKESWLNHIFKRESKVDEDIELQAGLIRNSN